MTYLDDLAFNVMDRIGHVNIGCDDYSLHVLWKLLSLYTVKYKCGSQYYSTISPISITVIGIGNIILTHWGLVMPQIWVNIGSGNGLLPDGTKPLPEPMLTYHQ